MHAESLSRPDALRLLPPIALEASLLELFAPTIAPVPVNASSVRSGYSRLWRADAIHRAKNMAQLTVSLANVADHPSRLWLPREVTSQARCLSRAYEELGSEEGARASVPCAELLTEVASRLGDIFGRCRQIAITVSADAVSAPSDVRRALILIGSELIINALKYGYPTGTGGTISVSLATWHGEIELVVEDDGVGLVDSYSEGHGGGLLDQLRTVLGATVTRHTNRKGHGYRVATSVPVGGQGADA